MSEIIIDSSAGKLDGSVREALSLLYNTRAGECALDRDFGLDWSIVDLPLPEAKARLAAEIITKTRKYEGDRADVSSVSFLVKEDGVLVPKVVIECLT